MITKKLPIGIENFEEMQKQDFYYVDKTGLIVDLLAGWGKVNLFTRPRRFGKTLNMSMLKCFFEIGTDKSLFDGLAVSKEKALCETYMGKYPVVFVSLKGVDGLTFETAYRALCSIIRREALRLEFLLDSDKPTENEKKSLNRILTGEYDDQDIRDSLQMLCTLLEKHYGQKPILLIDEYDVPLDKAYYHGYYPQMIDLIRAMFQAALKTNSSLFFAVLTGCLRVSKESIFTGLNNLMVHSISEQSFHGFLFGVGQRVTVHQKLKTDTFLPDDLPKHVICVLECQPIHVLERNEYHGVFPHVFLAELLLFRNPQSIEKALVCSNLKKALQHAHVERLAEPARAREKVDLAPVSHEVDDHPRLIYIVKILAAQLFKAVDSHR